MDEESSLRLQLVEAQDQVAQAQKGHATEIKAMEAEMVRANTTRSFPRFLEPTKKVRFCHDRLGTHIGNNGQKSVF